MDTTRRFAKLIIYSLIITTALSACGSRRTGERLDRQQRELEDLRRQLAESRRQIEAQMFGFGRKPDLSGRPGPISIMGALVQNAKSTVPALSITYVGGQEREFPTLTRRARPGLELDETDSTYINLGCADPEARPEVAGLRPVEPEGEAFTFLSARVVLLCGHPELGIVSTEIVTSRLILDHADLTVEGTNYSHLAIRANELILNGQNVIRTRAVPALHGPILVLSNVTTRGAGKLAIESEAYSGPPPE